MCLLSLRWRNNAGISRRCFRLNADGTQKFRWEQHYLHSCLPPQYEPRDCRFVWCPEERFGISERDSDMFGNSRLVKVAHVPKVSSALQSELRQEVLKTYIGRMISSCQTSRIELRS